MSPRHPEVAEPQPNRSMQDLECYPAFGSSASSRRGGGRILSNLIGGQTLKRVQGDKILKNLFTYSLTHLLTSKKAAFTLAEVLITLAIIGVVAAMTIPTLITTYKKKVVETKLVKFYSMMNEIVRLSEIDNGNRSSWEVSLDAADFYNKYFAPYLKTAKIDDTDPQDTYIYFNDGSQMHFYNNSDPNIMHITYCPIGDCENSVSGISNFTFAFYPSNNVHQNYFCTTPYWGKAGIDPLIYIGQNREYDSEKDCYTVVTPKNNEELKALMETTAYPYGCHENGGIWCTALIQMNNWKFPKDYPVKF